MRKAMKKTIKFCRSREGAWIEISPLAKAKIAGTGRSREGAWIEILLLRIKLKLSIVAPARERGLKSS